jgi:hypothetical protein
MSTGRLVVTTRSAAAKGSNRIAAKVVWRAVCDTFNVPENKR